MGGPDALGDLSVTMVSDRSFVYPALHSFLLGKFRVLSFDYSPLFIFFFFFSFGTMLFWWYFGLGGLVFCGIENDHRWGYPTQQGSLLGGRV